MFNVPRYVSVNLSSFSGKSPKSFSSYPFVIVNILLFPYLFLNSFSRPGDNRTTASAFSTIILSSFLPSSFSNLNRYLPIGPSIYGSLNSAIHL